MSARPDITERDEARVDEPVPAGATGLVVMTLIWLRALGRVVSINVAEAHGAQWVIPARNYMRGPKPHGRTAVLVFVSTIDHLREHTAKGGAPYVVALP